MGDGDAWRQTSGKVAIAAVVGNEDGAHHISGILFQALNDVGFTLAANAAHLARLLKAAGYPAA